MARQSDNGTLPIVELLSVGAGMLTDEDRSFETPVVVLTVRPEPQHSWMSFSFAFSPLQARRLRDDLNRLFHQEQPHAQVN